jgi:fumarate hydratase class II
MKPKLFFCLTNGEAKFAFIFQTGPSYPHGSLDLVETAPGFSELPGKIDVVSFENQD